jgi:hypothetical protein
MCSLECLHISCQHSYFFYQFFSHNILQTAAILASFDLAVSFVKQMELMKNGSGRSLVWNATVFLFLNINCKENIYSIFEDKLQSCMFSSG